MLDEAVDGVRDIEAQTAEGRTAMECIDRMAQDKGDARGRREADGDELLTKHVVRIVFLR